MSRSQRSDISFLPLGGCGEIGMNFNLFGHDGQWIAVDCGITLEQVPGAVRPAVQMPDLGFIAARREQLVGLIVTQYGRRKRGRVDRTLQLLPQVR